MHIIPYSFESLISSELVIFDEICDSIYDPIFLLCVLLSLLNLLCWSIFSLGSLDLLFVFHIFN